MCYLLSKPDDWEVNVKHLATTCKEGRDAIYKVIDELLEEGYMSREQQKEKGRFLGYDYTVNEQARKPEPENTLPEKPYTVESTILNTEGLNTEESKGPVSPATKSPVKKEEVPIRDRKISFLKLIIDWIAVNPSKYPKLMYNDFAKYWIESSFKKKKVKLRFEDQEYFDVGRRLGTWFQKVKDETTKEYWEKENQIGTVNDLFKKLL